MNEEKLYMSISPEYYVSADGSLVNVSPILKDGEVVGQTETAIANHTPILKELRTVDNGVEITEQLVFNVRRDYKMEPDIAVTLKDILGQTPNLKFGAANRIFPKVRGAKSLYTDAIQIQCANAPRFTIYQHTGYTIIDGERVFLNGGYSVTAEGLTDKHTVEMPDTLSIYRFTNKKHDELSSFST